MIIISKEVLPEPSIRNYIVERINNWNIIHTKEVKKYVGKNNELIYVLGENLDEIELYPLLSNDIGINTLLILLPFINSPFVMIVMKRDHIIVARDPLGVYPMYFSRRAKVVSSDYGILRKHKDLRSINPANLYIFNNQLEPTVVEYYSFSTASLKFPTEEIYRELYSFISRVNHASRKIAVAFSGGIDSSIIASIALKIYEVELFTVGLRDSYDLQRAQEVSRNLGLNLNVITICKDDIEEELTHIKDKVPLRSIMDISIAIGFCILAKELNKRGYKKVLVGQLADELFAGYSKYARISTGYLNEVLLHDVTKSHLGFERDVGAFNTHNVTPLFPFAQKRLVSKALKLDPCLKIRNGFNKFILRELAKRLELPDIVVKGPKKAFQFGSKIENIIKKFNLAQRVL